METIIDACFYFLLFMLGYFVGVRKGLFDAKKIIDETIKKNKERTESEETRMTAEDALRNFNRIFDVSKEIGSERKD